MCNDENLRFDFSHFAKMTDDEIAAVEKIVNRKIRQNIPVIIKEMPKDEAIALGAMALFGEKYGDKVRVVIMDENYSIELCGGTHVMHTGELNIFKIVNESAVAAGVRRIEALAGCKAEAYIMQQLHQLQQIKSSFKNPKDIVQTLDQLQQDKLLLQKQIERIETKQLLSIKDELIKNQQYIGSTHFIGAQVDVNQADSLRKLCTDIKSVLQTPFVICLTALIGNKPHVAIAVDEQNALDAAQIIKQHIAPVIKGGGGGQRTLATAGGQDFSQLHTVLDLVKQLIA